MKISKLVGYNIIYLFLLSTMSVASFQSFDRQNFDCEFICRNPHILYTLSLPLFFVASGITIFLLFKTHRQFTPENGSRIVRFILKEDLALIWIWLFMSIWAFVLAYATDIGNIKGPFVFGVLLSMVYTIYNIIVSVAPLRKMK